MELIEIHYRNIKIDRCSEREADKACGRKLRLRQNLKNGFVKLFSVFEK